MDRQIKVLDCGFAIYTDIAKFDHGFGSYHIVEDVETGQCGYGKTIHAAHEAIRTGHQPDLIWTHYSWRRYD